MKRYQRLWDNLRRKWYPSPHVYLVCGSYPVAHEGGYDWNCGAFLVEAEAEAYAERLRREVRDAKRALAPLFTASSVACANERRAQHAYYESTNYDFNATSWYDLPESQAVRDAWHQAHTAYYDAAYAWHEEHMADKQIPWVPSHLFKDNMDGPLTYTVVPVRLSFGGWIVHTPGVQKIQEMNLQVSMYVAPDPEPEPDPQPSTRELAALLCQLCASNHDGLHDAYVSYGVDNQEAHNLARAAFYAADGFSSGDSWCETMARAEAMINEGWEP